MTSTQLVWLITGTSSVISLLTAHGILYSPYSQLSRAGIGKELALEALTRGDKVIATARGRSVAKLDELRSKGAATLELDVAAPLDTIHASAKEALAIYGRVDVLVNNAG
ncbi:hypothetical protein NMY22_g4365 [Coprinellus aureogranulatus]|nr:hypothetical protein NMY22_g4365 [Coprinellus aureogranulatus]